MQSKLIHLIMIILMTSACSNNSTNPEKWTDEEVESWYNKKEWLGGWNVAPDNSVNKRNFAIYYHKSPRHWDQAFQFLKTADLKSLPLGTQELEGKHLFVSVSEYQGKNRTDALYESHRKYIDIQYVIEGKEIIGRTSLDKVKVIEPYSDEKDIVFYEYDGGDYMEATPKNFFIFTPEDAHRPSISAGDSSMVKKLVVKILIA